MKIKNGISIIFSFLISFSAYSQTSVEYQKKIDSLKKIKSSITLQLNELEKQIIILKEQKSKVWANEQVGQIYVFIRDDKIYSIENKYFSVGRVKKGKRVLFIKEVDEFGMEVLIDGEKYYARSSWLRPLNGIKAKEAEQIIADSLAVVNATPMLFTYNAPIYKSSTDTEPLMKVPSGTEILFVKSIKVKGASNCLIIYKGEEYYASTYDLITEEQVQQRLEEKQLAKERRKKLKEERRMHTEERRKVLTTLYGATTANKIIDRKIWLGMTDEMAVESWGKPDDINRTVSAYGVKEQWIYGDISNRTYLYFEDGMLTTWQD